jgi:hypothetical protein
MHVLDPLPNASDRMLTALPNCAPKGLQFVLSVPVYSTDNIASPVHERSVNRRLKMPAGKKLICPHVKGAEFCSKRRTNDKPN